MPAPTWPFPALFGPPARHHCPRSSWPPSSPAGDQGGRVVLGHLFIRGAPSTARPPGVDHLTPPLLTHDGGFAASLGRVRFRSDLLQFGQVRSSGGAGPCGCISQWISCLALPAPAAGPERPFRRLAGVFRPIRPVACKEHSPEDIEILSNLGHWSWMVDAAYASPTARRERGPYPA